MSWRAALTAVVLSATAVCAATPTSLSDDETRRIDQGDTVVTTLTRERDAWVAQWTLVSARYARRIEGSLRVAPRAGGSLVTYTQVVDPGALGATFGSPATLAAKVVATVEALTARTERLAVSEPQQLASLVATLTALVAPAR
jgi:hypothetical protein